MSRRALALAGVAAALAAALAAGIVLARQSSATPGAVEAAGSGRPAPALAGTDPITGEWIELADFRGRPVVVNVWASWCPGCRAEAEALREFAEAHPEVTVLGIDLQDRPEEARAFYEEWGWTHPSIADPDGALAGKLRLVALPSTFFLDAEHRIAASIFGETDRAGFEAGLEQATAS